MQLKERTEDTADNKVRGDWMLINLCVLHSAQYFCISSSLLSCSRLSRPPLKGMTRAPGSWPSTHSLIFSSLAEMKGVKSTAFTQEGLFFLGCMNIHGGWLSVRLFAGDCALEVGWSFLGFISASLQTVKSLKECNIKSMMAFVHSAHVLQTGRGVFLLLTIKRR